MRGNVIGHLSLAPSARHWGMPRVIGGCAASLVLMLAAGCAGPRVVFLPAADAPVRAGPNLSGQVYVWTGAAWELSGNSVTIPEGFYIWDAGDAAPTNTVKGK